jgi:hypothetical protein
MSSVRNHTKGYFQLFVHLWTNVFYMMSSNSSLTALTRISNSWRGFSLGWWTVVYVHCMVSGLASTITFCLESPLLLFIFVITQISGIRRRRALVVDPLSLSNIRIKIPSFIWPRFSSRGRNKTLDVTFIQCNKVSNYSQVPNISF